MIVVAPVDTICAACGRIVAAGQAMHTGDRCLTCGSEVHDAL